LQDTGGFFITVLYIKAEFKAKPEEGRKTTTPSSASGINRLRKEEEEVDVVEPE
jgi:hypothetical protein